MLSYKVLIGYSHKVTVVSTSEDQAHISIAYKIYLIW